MKKLISALCVAVLVTATASAHPGKTDADGGHVDTSTGEYHYHHGYPAHQHIDGTCPYDFDDKTGWNSGSSSSSGSSDSADTSSAPDGYPNPIHYTVAAGSHLIDRTYYLNEDYTFFYCPWDKENLPHGDTETNNTNFLQFDNPYLGDVIYKYGLENQSRQFQEGATFGLHEASCYYDQWYHEGYIDGQLNGQVDEADQQYDYPAHTGDESYGTAYNAGYDYALQWLIDQNSDYLPSSPALAATLQQHNRITDNTSLTDQSQTYEDVFDKGVSQASDDFYAYLDQLIVNDGLETEQTEQTPDTAAPFLFYILLVVISAFCGFLIAKVTQKHSQKE